LLGFFAHAAGVEQHQVCRLQALGGGVPCIDQHVAQAIGVVLIHLAAEGDDVVAPHGLRD
jgi:hypothetical protein